MAGHFLTGVNLYVDDNSPATSSKHLILEECALPEMEEETSEHNPGGSVGGIEVGMGKLKPLKASFKIAGYDPHTMGYFGLGAGIAKPYTAYADLTDPDTGEHFQLVARMLARLTSAKSDAMKSGEKGSGDYELTGMRTYELTIGGVQIYEFSYNPPVWKVSGKDRFALTRRNLAIPG